MSSKPVIKAARSGYDVETADEKYLTLDSSKNTLKQYQEYTGSLSASAMSFDSDTIDHDLGYQPFIKAYIKLGGETAWREVPFSKFSTSPAYIVESFIERVDTDSLKIWLNTFNIYSAPSASATADYLVRVYIDPREDIWYE